MFLGDTLASSAHSLSLSPQPLYCLSQAAQAVQPPGSHRLSGMQGSSLAGNLSARRLHRSHSRSLANKQHASGARPLTAAGSSAEIRTLSQLDEQLIERLRAGDIRLVRSSWLLLPSVTKIPTRQELEKLEERSTLPGEELPLLTPDEGAALVLRGNRTAGALSHGWLLAGDCDPKRGSGSQW